MNIKRRDHACGLLTYTKNREKKRAVIVAGGWNNKCHGYGDDENDKKCALSSIETLDIDNITEGTVCTIFFM